MTRDPHNHNSDNHNWPVYEPDPFPAADRARQKRISVRVAARTDRGLERANNEDRAAFADLGSNVARAYEPPATALLVPTANAFVALVCDGMGGEAGGEIASGLAVETVIDYLRGAKMMAATREGCANATARALVASVEAASARIKHESKVQPRYARMGTTATLAAICDQSLICAQVGDSRAYLFRGDGKSGGGGDGATLTQITHDQTMAELLRSSGTVPLDAIHEIVGSNVILQALGSSVRLDVAITYTHLQAGDTVLLCSDGLSGFISDRDIAQTLSDHADVGEACDALIKRVLAVGAPDNVTCLAFKYDDAVKGHATTR